LGRRFEAEEERTEESKKAERREMQGGRCTSTPTRGKEQGSASEQPSAAGTGTGSQSPEAGRAADDLGPQKKGNWPCPTWAE
jgi:hypothetical protein